MKTDVNTVGNWHLDGNADDSSGNGNHGTLVNTPTPISGKFGTAYSFNGTTQLITVPDDTTLDFNTNNDFTIECWFRTSSSGTIGICDKGDTDGRYFIRMSSGLVSFVFDYGVTSDTATTTGTYDDGLWHYLACTADRSVEQLIYVDGTQDGQNTISSGGDVSSSIQLTIGRSTDTNEWDGDLEEFRISSTARSAKEIRETYNKMVGVYALN